MPYFHILPSMLTPMFQEITVEVAKLLLTTQNNILKLSIVSKTLCFILYASKCCRLSECVLNCSTATYVFNIKTFYR